MIINEERLEPLAQYFRFQRGTRYLNKTKAINLVDLGSGSNINFYKYATKKGIKFNQYIAVDPLLHTNVKNIKGKPNIKLLKVSLTNKIPLPDNSADYIVGFAFLEHLDYPEEILLDSLRVLKEGGKLILTIPTPIAKNFLELLCYKFKLLSSREINEHKRYFNKEDLINILSRSCYKINVRHKYFEFGLNNLVVVEKLSPAN